MDATYEREGDILYAAIAGRLDAAAAPQFEKSLNAELEDVERGLILDMGRLTYINSTGLRIVLMAAKKLQGRGGAIVLHSMPDTIREIFAISGFDKLVKITNSQPAARKMME